MKFASGLMLNKKGLQPIIPFGNVVLQNHFEGVRVD
jgi:hypothetical protein